MKKVIVFLLITISSFAQSQLRFKQLEEVTINIAIDPTASIKENGFNFVAELEYSGKIYAKVGVERFDALMGGYNDIHGAIGINLTSGLFERFRYYGGIRLAKVNRNGGFRPIFGQEIGIDYNVSDNVFIGLRATRDNRQDQELLGWNPEIKYSGFIRIGYKWKLNK